MNLNEMTFDEANQAWCYGRISDEEMRAFARRWVVGKASYRLHRGLIQELHCPGFGMEEYWTFLSYAWNIPEETPTKKD